MATLYSCSSWTAKITRFQNLWINLRSLVILLVRKWWFHYDSERWVDESSFESAKSVARQMYRRLDCFGGNLHSNEWPYFLHQRIKIINDISWSRCLDHPFLISRLAWNLFVRFTFRLCVISTWRLFVRLPFCLRDSCFPNLLCFGSPLPRSLVLYCANRQPFVDHNKFHRYYPW